jgi:PKD repeat protein
LVTSAPNTYHFENTSTPLSITDSIRWTFGDGTSSNQVSPNHTYTQFGTYNVCLRVQKRNINGTLSNCIREICHTVVVGNPNTCNLQPYPNPATNSISVNVFLSQSQMIDVYIYNLNLLLVKEQHQQGIPGNNVVTLAIGDLVPGYYTMRVIRGNDICYAHFLKL